MPGQHLTQFSLYLPIRLPKIVITFPLELFSQTANGAKLPPLSHPSLYLITLAPSLVGGPVIDFLQVTGSFGIWEQLKQDAVTPEWYHRC